MPSPTPDTTSLPQTPSMEEVWNDIKLSSLSHYSSNLYAFSSPSSSSSSATSHSALQSFVLHEFMSSGIPHSRSPPTCLPNSSTHDSVFLASLQHHHQPTLLTLTHKHPQHSCLHALDSSPSPTNKKPRCDTYQPTDRRHKRMMKNRESAARSRARKQVSLCLHCGNVRLLFFFSFLSVS